MFWLKFGFFLTALLLFSSPFVLLRFNFGYCCSYLLTSPNCSSTQCICYSLTHKTTTKIQSQNPKINYASILMLIQAKMWNNQRTNDRTNEKKKIGAMQRIRKFGECITTLIYFFRSITLQWIFTIGNFFLLFLVTNLTRTHTLHLKFSWKKNPLSIFFVC